MLIIMLSPPSSKFWLEINIYNIVSDFEQHLMEKWDINPINKFICKIY